MNGLDIAFIVILGYTLIRGLFRGLVKEFASIFGLILGFIAANAYYGQIMKVVQKVLANPQYAAILSYILIFLAVLGGIIFIGAGLRKLMEAVMLGWLDRLGGGALGAIKGGLVCSLLLFFLTMFMAPASPFLAESRLSPFVNQFAGRLVRLVPQEMKDTFGDKSQSLKKAWEGSTFDKLRNPE
jgi:membrane protein required for colicin V production